MTYCILSLTVSSVANVALSRLRKVLAETCGCLTWLGLPHPYLLLDTKGVLAALGGGDNTKVLSTDLSHWESIFNELSAFFSLQALLLREL